MLRFQMGPQDARPTVVRHQQGEAQGAANLVLLRLREESPHRASFLLHDSSAVCAITMSKLSIPAHPAAASSPVAAATSSPVAAPHHLLLASPSCQEGRRKRRRLLLLLLLGWERPRPLGPEPAARYHLRCTTLYTYISVRNDRTVGRQVVVGVGHAALACRQAALLAPPALAALHGAAGALVLPLLRGALRRLYGFGLGLLARHRLRAFFSICRRRARTRCTAELIDLMDWFRLHAPDHTTLATPPAPKYNVVFIKQMNHVCAMSGCLAGSG